MVFQLFDVFSVALRLLSLTASLTFAFLTFAFAFSLEVVRILGETSWGVFGLLPLFWITTIEVRLITVSSFSFILPVKLPVGVLVVCLYKMLPFSLFKTGRVVCDVFFPC